VTEPFQNFKSQDVEGLVDESRLAAWLDGNDLAPGAPITLRRISGGMSNESIGIERAGERWVLRRPAKRALEGADRGMRREFRVLSALEGSDAPHPRPLALCTDPTVAGCVFYVMEHVDGFVPAMNIPEPFANDRSLQRDVALACMDALGALAQLDWRARGLSDFGRPEGFHERQVGRWKRQLESYGARDLTGLEEVADWLEANIPARDAWQPAIMHGDYHTANLLIAPGPPARVAAILDWENATIGDPLLDLAGFLRLFRQSSCAGWAESGELIARWERASGRQAPDLRYYTTLSAYKLSVMLEGIFQRSFDDPTRGDAKAIGDMALRIMQEAQESFRG